MANAKYLRITDTSKVICRLKKNQRYYFEVAYAEKEDDDDYESIWVGKSFFTLMWITVFTQI